MTYNDIHAYIHTYIHTYIHILGGSPFRRVRMNLQSRGELETQEL